MNAKGYAKRRSMTERIPLTVRSQLRSVLFAVRNVNRPPVDTDIPSSEVGWVPVARRKLADNRSVYVWLASQFIDVLYRGN